MKRLFTSIDIRHQPEVVVLSGSSDYAREGLAWARKERTIRENDHLRLRALSKYRTVQGHE